MPIHFRKQIISAENFEAAGVFDVDNDGVLDIVSGGFWYKGPDFKHKFCISAEAKRYADYYDDFSVIPLDIDGDGKMDFVTGGWWGESLRWRQNSGDPHKPWAEHILAEGVGNIETTRAWDIDGDGEPEIVPNTPNHPLCAYKLIRDQQGKGTGKFSKHVLSSRALGHGLGFGDINGDGKPELITQRGWLEAPAAGPLKEEWIFHEAFDLGPDASIPILVCDLNGDGVNELIVGSSHSYGLNWWEQKNQKWIKHPIDPFNSQYHDLHWVDLDGDGQPELITGKRYLAHCGRDPGEFDDLGIYYFKWTGEGFAKQIIDHGPPGTGAGCGIQFALADLLNTGRLDVIAPGKDGLKVYFNLG